MLTGSPKSAVPTLTMILKTTLMTAKKTTTQTVILNKTKPACYCGLFYD